MRGWVKIFPLLPLLAGGCMTEKLWTEAPLDEWNEPAPSANLRVYQDLEHTDWLVIYDEIAGRNNSVRPRAFFLKANEKHLAGHQSPHFTRSPACEGWKPVPLYRLPPPNAPDAYGLTNAGSPGNIRLFAGGRMVSGFDLPVYPDAWGNVQRVAWTPLAVTADLTIIGGCVGYLWLYSGGPGISH